MTPKCPCCGTSGRDHRHFLGMGKCFCGSYIDHRHRGIKELACASLAPWWLRLFRLCFLGYEHAHMKCTVCGAKWRKTYSLQSAQVPPLPPTKKDEHVWN